MDSTEAVGRTVAANSSANWTDCIEAAAAMVQSVVFGRDLDAIGPVKVPRGPEVQKMATFSPKPAAHKLAQVSAALRNRAWHRDSRTDHLHTSEARLGTVRFIDHWIQHTFRSF